MQLRVTTIRTGRSFLADQRRRSHLSARHAIDGVVNEDDDDVFATVQGVDGLTGSDTCQVAVALVGEDKTVGPAALDTRSQCGSTTMGSFLPVYIYLIVREDGTTYRAHTYGLLFHTHFLDDLGNELMHHTVTTAWTIVHIVVVHQRRLLADDVLWLNYLISIHLYLFLRS